jgi:hypothetical protein
MGRFLLFLLVLIVGLLIGYCGGLRVLPPSYRHTITVGVFGTPSPVTVVPDTVSIRQQDTLRWFHPTADSFFIDMSVDPKGSPAVDSLVTASAGGYAVTVIREDALVDSVYKYLVTVWQGGQQDTLDPHIIPREEEGEH